MSEKLRLLGDLPAPTLGAPAPHVIANERRLGLLYYPNGADGQLACVRFESIYAVSWGPPNDERRAELSMRTAEGPYEIEGSLWIAGLLRKGAKQNSARFHWMAALRHFRIPFHDSTLDVAAAGYTVHLRYAPLVEELPELARQILS